MMRTIPYGRLLASSILALAVAACGSSSAPPEISPDEALAALESAAAEPAATEPAEAAAMSQAQEGAAVIDVTTGRGLCAAIPSDMAASALGSGTDEGVPDYSQTFGHATCTFTAIDSTESVKIQYETKDRTQWEEEVDKVGMTDETIVEVGEVAYQSSDAVLSGGTRLAAFGDGAGIWVVIAKEGDAERVLPAARQIGQALLEAMQGS